MGARAVLRGEGVDGHELMEEPPLGEATRCSQRSCASCLAPSTWRECLGEVEFDAIPWDRHTGRTGSVAADRVSGMYSSRPDPALFARPCAAHDLQETCRRLVWKQPAGRSERHHQHERRIDASVETRRLGRQEARKSLPSGSRSAVLAGPLLNHFC